MAAAGGVWAKGTFYPAKFLEYMLFSPTDVKGGKSAEKFLARWKEKSALLASGAAVKAAQQAETTIADLNHEQAFLFSLNGTQILHRVGGKSEVSFTDSELASMKGRVLTHNHPSGTSFSAEDVLMASQHKLAAIRAVGTNKLGEKYEYEIRPSMPTVSGGWPSTIQIQQVIAEQNAEVKNSFWSQIDAGKMTMEYANANHSHAVWSGAASQLGLVYTRRRLN